MPEDVGGQKGRMGTGERLLRILIYVVVEKKGGALGWKGGKGGSNLPDHFSWYCDKIGGGGADSLLAVVRKFFSRSLAFWSRA